MARLLDSSSTLSAESAVSRMLSAFCRKSVTSTYRADLVSVEWKYGLAGNVRIVSSDVEFQNDEPRADTLRFSPLESLEIVNPRVKRSCFAHSRTKRADGSEHSSASENGAKAGIRTP